MDAPTLRLEEKSFEMFSKLKQKLDRVGEREAVKFLKAARWKGIKNVVMNDDGRGSADEL